MLVDAKAMWRKTSQYIKSSETHERVYSSTFFLCVGHEDGEKLFYNDVIGRIEKK